MAEPTPGFWRLLATAMTDGETTEHGLTGSGPGVGGIGASVTGVGGSGASVTGVGGSGANVSHGTNGVVVGGGGAIVLQGTNTAPVVVVVFGSGEVVVRESLH